jgi:MFS transporter, ACS family, D-galactonate transporter
MDPRNKPTKVRFYMLALIFVNVVINYMDRSNISVAISAIDKEFKFSTIETGLILSAFGWTYVAFQIPGGMMIDKFGPRLLYAFSLISWSIVTLFQSVTKGFISLFGLRLATGIFEAPAFPTNNQVVTSWFPDNERASAIGVYTSGQFLGLAFLTPVLTAVQYYLGWRSLFIVTGIGGIIWGIIWYKLYRDPKEHLRVNSEELKKIETGGGLIEAESKEKKNNSLKWHDLKKVLSHRKLWGIYIGQFAVNSTLWFFLTWFPKYLIDYRHINFMKSGLLASLPFIAAFCGVLFSGFLSDFLIKKNFKIEVARKLPIIAGLILSISIIGANYVSSPALIILFMAIAFFGNGLASITWVFVSTLAPKHLVGLTGGVFNFIGGLAAVVVPMVIGFLVSGGNFSPALIFISSLALLGTCSYIFLVGKIERIEQPGIIPTSIKD